MIPPNKPASERQIQNEILRAYATRADMRLWRANTGAAVSGRRLIRFGVPGQADLTGILPGGIRLEIEVKSAVGLPSKAQRDYQRLIERFGGVYVLARSVADVDAALARYFHRYSETVAPPWRRPPDMPAVPEGVQPPHPQPDRVAGD